MKFFTKTAMLALCLCAGLASAVAADFRDKELERRFQQGTLRLEHSYFGQGIGGGTELANMYARREWPELVEGVVSKRFVSDLYYYYLGAAAEALGYKDAALVYYREGEAAYRRNDTCNFGFDSCRLVRMPDTLFARLEALANAEKPRHIVVTVTSLNGQPIADARVSAVGKRAGASCTTDANGTCSLDTMLQPKESLPINVLRSGMFARFDSVAAGKLDQVIVMRSYRDMMCQSLLASGSPAQVAAVEKQVELIAGVPQLEHASLDLHGICTSNFKKTSYLSLALTNEVTFNENKLTSYMIGANVFDDVVKKMLLVMGVTAVDLKVEGFHIAVTGTKQVFADTASPTKLVNFDFYFPRPLVEQYLNKDISGQKLLDGSVILLNDDRVDLKLQ